MTPKTRDRSLGDGVYFAPNDYVGLGPRVITFAIDSLVLAAIFWLVSFLWSQTIGINNDAIFLVLLFIAWIYLVPLKRSNFRTIGYHLIGCRLVTLKGTRPSLVMLTLRALSWIFGPFNFLIDLIWCGIDDDRQTMRDRYTLMCLVRNNAAPVGTGEIHLAYFNAFGYNLVYPRVVHPKPDSNS